MPATIECLVIATRGSQLALWQANHVKSRLEARIPGPGARPPAGGGPG